MSCARKARLKGRLHAEVYFLEWSVPVTTRRLATVGGERVGGVNLRVFLVDD